MHSNLRYRPRADAKVLQERVIHKTRPAGRIERQPFGDIAVAVEVD